MSGSDFTEIIERMRLDAEGRARSRGFDSVEAMAAHDDAEERRAELAQTEREALWHRRSVVAAMNGRLRLEMAESITSGAGLGETMALRAVRGWLASSRPVLVISGGTGAGKTVAAAWALASRVGTFQCVRAPRLGGAFERWSSDREDGAEALRLHVTTMLVDDLGKEPLEDRRVPLALEEIFDARQTPALRTVVTTNLSRDKIRTRYSESVLSRLSQNASVIDLDQAPDLRRGNR